MEPTKEQIDEYNKYIFITKPNEWFKEGTEAKFEGWEDYLYTGSNGIHHGVFEGTIIITEENHLIKGSWKEYKIGDEVIDRECCGFDEFELILREEYKNDK